MYMLTGVKLDSNAAHTNFGAKPIMIIVINKRYKSQIKSASSPGP